MGQDTDGTVTADDVGLGWATGKQKRTSSASARWRNPVWPAPGRRQLVGILTTDGATLLDEGAQITATAGPPAGPPALGHVTSSYWSEALRRPITLGLVKDGRNRIGTTLYVPLERHGVAVELVSAVFFDPEGVRLRG